MEWSDDDEDVYQNKNYYNNNTNNNNNNRNDNNNNINEYYQDDSDNSNFDFNKVRLKNEKQQVDESLACSDDNDDNDDDDNDNKNTNKGTAGSCDNNNNNTTTNISTSTRPYEEIQIHRPDRFIPWDRIVASIYNNPKNNSNTDNNNDDNITNDTILKYVPYPEMDQLLSWATDYNNNESNSNEDDNNKNIKTTLLQDDKYLLNNPLECLSNSSTNNVPINPIYLQYIQDTAIELITGQEDKQRRKQTRKYKSNNTTGTSGTIIQPEPIVITSSSSSSSGSKNKSTTNNDNVDNKQESQEQQEEEEQNEKTEKKKRHYSKRGIQYYQKYSEFYEKIVPTNVLASIENCLLEKFDTSAFVAIGIIIEEMITSSLLPLAQRHINYCKQLEKQEQQEKDQQEKYQQIDCKSHNYSPPIQPYDIQKKHSFFHWTLPPEEAIANLIPTTYSRNQSKDDIKSDSQYQTILGLPSAYPPTRCLTENSLPYLKTKESIEYASKKRTAVNVPLPDVPRKKKLCKRLREKAIVSNSPYDVSVNNWCMTRKYPDIVRNIQLKRRVTNDDKLSIIKTRPIYNYDIDLFQLLVPQLPVPYRTQKEMKLPKSKSRTIDKRYIPDPCGLQYPQSISKINNSFNPIPTNSYSIGSITQSINTMYQIKNEEVASNNTNDNDIAIPLTSTMKENDLRKKQDHSDCIGSDDDDDNENAIDDNNNKNDTSKHSLVREMNSNTKNGTMSSPIPIDTSTNNSNRKIRPLMSQLRKKLLLNETQPDKQTFNSSKKRQLNHHQKQEVTVDDRQQQQQRQLQQQEDIRQQREEQQRPIRMRQANQQLQQQIEQSQQQQQLQIQQQIGISQQQQLQQQGQEGPQSQERQRRQQQRRRGQEEGEEKQQQQGDAQLLMDHRQVIESQIVDSWFGRSEGTEDDDFETAEL